MPGKPRQRKGKYSARARKYNAPSQNTQPVQAADQAAETVSESAPAASVAPVRTRRNTVLPENFIVEHPFVGAELKSIGMLASLVIIILVVMAFILS